MSKDSVEPPGTNNDGGRCAVIVRSSDTITTPLRTLELYSSCVWCLCLIKKSLFFLIVRELRCRKSTQSACPNFITLLSWWHASLYIERLQRDTTFIHHLFFPINLINICAVGDFKLGSIVLIVKLASPREWIILVYLYYSLLNL